MTVKGFLVQTFGGECAGRGYADVTTDWEERDIVMRFPLFLIPKFPFDLRPSTVIPIHLGRFSLRSLYAVFPRLSESPLETLKDDEARA